MGDPKATIDGKFKFQKIYTELDYLAGGVLVIPPGAAKPLKSSQDNSYVCWLSKERRFRLTRVHDVLQIFFCNQGSVEVLVHRSKFNIGP